jgi:hypothetical protein
MLVGNGAFGAVTGAGARALRIFAVRAAELDHEAVDDAMKMQAIVEARLGELDEVPCRRRHLVCEQFDGDVA